MFVDYIDVPIMIVVQFVDSSPMFAACSFISVFLFVLKSACLDSSLSFNSGLGIHGESIISLFFFSSYFRNKKK